MLLLYSILCLGLQVVFWRIKNVIADAVAVSCMGFLLAPFFATVSSLTRRHSFNSRDIAKG
jgi:fucose permease